MIKPKIAILICILLLETVNQINSECCYGFIIAFRWPSGTRENVKICYDGFEVKKFYCAVGPTGCNMGGCNCEYGCLVNEYGQNRTEAKRLFAERYGVEVLS